MRRIGFSTGALARGDFRGALEKLRLYGLQVVELSALRASELDPLANALPSLDLSDFSFVSIVSLMSMQKFGVKFIRRCVQK